MRIARRVLSCVTAVLIGAASTSGWSAGFQLFEQGVSGLGNAFAGSAAAEDATTVFWNPAGMSFLPEGHDHFSGGAHLLRTSAEFNKDSATTAGGRALTGGNGGDAGGNNFLPNLFYAHRFGNGLAIGLGISPQFGLKTEYAEDWVGRYQATKSELTTITVNPSISFAPTEWLAIGGGINILKADANLENKINFGTLISVQNPANGATLIPAGQLSQGADGSAKISGDDLAYGFNIGAMFKIGQATKVGVHYRSKIKVKVDGTADFTAPTAVNGIPAPLAALTPVITNNAIAGFNNNFRDQNIEAEVTLPDMFSVGGHVQIDDQWALMGDVSYTRWSEFKELRVKFKGGLPDSVTPENWDNTYKIAAGVSYKPSNRWTLRAGLAYDQQAAPDEFVTPRIPDSSRTWITLGFNVAFTPKASLDVGYAHIMVDGPSINKTSDEGLAPLRTTLRGEYDSQVDILSAQFNLRF